MISFLGKCVQNFIDAVKYTLKGNVTFKSVISQAAIIGFDSLGICLMIVIIASSVIALQVSKQFLLSGADDYIGGFLGNAPSWVNAPGFSGPAIAAREGNPIKTQNVKKKVSTQVNSQKVFWV